MTESIGRPIAVLYHQFIRYMMTALRDTELTAGEYLFLPPLYAEDGQSQENLSQRLVIDKAATARAMRSLEEKGFVTRRRDDSDRRCNRIFLTQKARACEGLIQRALTGWTALLAAELPDESADALRLALESMVTRVKATDFAAYLTSLPPIA